MKDPSNYTILVVDDEEDLRDSFKVSFELDGYNVLVAASGNDALDILAKNKVDFVLTDVQMPDGTGVDFLVAARNMHPALPVILMVTGFSQLSRESALERGAVDLLDKPVDWKLVSKILKQHLD